jgi:hypothetical protein
LVADSTEVSQLVIVFRRKIKAEVVKVEHFLLSLLLANLLFIMGYVRNIYECVLENITTYTLLSLLWFLFYWSVLNLKLALVA